jgi:putative glycosyltransferase (TIGR04372 family)
MYLCKIDAGIDKPKQKYFDIFYMGGSICNRQLEIMWRRILFVGPGWLFSRVARINKLIPGGVENDIGLNIYEYRDMHGLLNKTKPHLEFTAEELLRGENELVNVIGVPLDAKYVCLNVRDSAYLGVGGSVDWSYHDFRDSDVNNYLLAAEALTVRGYYVIRMGAKVNSKLETSNPKIIDYATNGVRSDFMDIYLGANCEFCISTGSGWECVPGWLFRRPICNVNHSPIGVLSTFLEKALLLTKHHYSNSDGRNLTLSEIVTRELDMCSETNIWKTKGITLIENSPEEIRDIAVEMAQRLEGLWMTDEIDVGLQEKFWKIFPKNSIDIRKQMQHSEINARYGANFLRTNPSWLQ